MGNHFLKLLANLAIFSMTLSFQFSSYVQHIENTTFSCWHQRPIFHLGINFLTVFGLTSYSGEGFHFGLKLLKKMFMLDLVSFLIQICRQGQHLELLGY
jgi:hypothetical protein